MFETIFIANIFSKSIKRNTDFIIYYNIYDIELINRILLYSNFAGLRFTALASVQQYYY